jgi:hypothetical protein
VSAEQPALDLPHAGPLPAPVAALRDWIDRSRLVAPLLVYVAFAAIIFVLQGSEPPLSIDHVSYFKLADEIRAEFAEHDYWRSFNAVRGYGVLLAYLFDVTGSHVLSLKLLLAAMTVGYLWAFQLLMGLFTHSRARAMLFALVSALFVSFGASIWGMTDFAASLNRTIIIPFVVLLVWFFFRNFSSPWRYAVMPGFILLSLLHLSALHVFLVFGAFEIFDFAWRRRFRVDRQVGAFIGAVAVSLVLQGVIENMGSGTGGFVRYTLQMTLPSVAEMLPNPQAKAPKQPTIQTVEVSTPRGGVVPSAPPGAPGPVAAATGIAATGGGGVGGSGGASTVIEPVVDAAPQVAATSKRMSNREAWRIELLAFPWRNFPPSLATLATIASSFGIIFLLAAWGAARSLRLGRSRSLDIGMIAFACGTLLAAFGLQMILWALRDRIPLFPINFEEIRAINMLMVPAVYFTYRLYELAAPVGGLSRRTVRIAVLVLFALQPVVLVKATPSSWRQGIIDAAVANGLLKSSDAPRMLYARQFLGLADEGRRFYYSSRAVQDWLERNLGPDEKVLTNLNELYGTRVKTVGPFLQVVIMDVWDPRRAAWAKSVEAIDGAMLARDLERVFEIARRLDAQYAIVDWPVPEAVYRDDFYAVVRVPQEPGR